MIPHRIAFPLLLLAAAFAGCGGGGGGAGNGVPNDAQPQDAAQPLVVEYDHTGDGQPDVVTLDTSTTPFRILEILEGAGAGEPVNTTELRKGEVIDAALSDALARYMTDSFEISARTELSLENSLGVRHRVTVFE